MRSRAMSSREWRNRLLLALLGTVSALLVLEGGTSALFRWPQVWWGRLPAPVEALLRHYHASFLGGGPVQFRPDCSEPDPEIFYRLRPGRCRFDSDEFSTEVRVSHRHLREDEEVDRASVLFLGDSFTLGWGVEREEAFPARIAADLGVPVTSVANSSYGTVREMLLLRRVRLSDFGVVVLQVHSNDAGENQAFITAGRHVSSRPEEYSQLVEMWRRINARWFLPYSHNWFSMAYWPVVRPRLAAVRPATAGEQARLVLGVLGAFASELKNRPILIFAASPSPDSGEFARAITAEDPPSGIGPITPLDPVAVLQAGDRFRFDFHWRPSGHRKVAEALEGPIREALGTLDPRESGAGRR